MPASPAILTGIGCLSYGELAGERMKLGLMLHDPEEEHDCFSDNTHNSHYYDQMASGTSISAATSASTAGVLEGPCLSELVAATRSGARRRDAGQARRHARRDGSACAARAEASRPMTR